jgi:outer membrane protein assembly factor BamD
MIRKLSFALLLLIAVLSGCNDFARLQKSQDMNEKYNKAVEYYNKKDYTKAQLLFDDLYSSIPRASEQGENVGYYLAYCNYEMGDYILAGYYFRNFYRTFPTSKRAAECLYLSAYCYYLLSPPYTLDQEETYTAIDQFQYFIQAFPNDTAHIRECNKLLDNLHTKLEKKAFHNSKMYYEIQDYKAAITSFELFLHDYPASNYREEVMYLMVEAKFKLAENSIESKKEDRLAMAVAECNNFLLTYKESEYTDEVNAVLDKAKKMQTKIANDKKTNR